MLCVGALLVWVFSNVALLRIVPLRFVKYSYTLKTLFSDSSNISFMPLYISQQANTLYKAGQSVTLLVLYSPERNFMRYNSTESNVIKDIDALHM